MKRFWSLTLALVCILGFVSFFSSCKKTAKVYTRYEITAEYSPENRTLTGAVKVTFENCSDSEISVLKFQMYPNAYRKNALYAPISTSFADAAYYAGESYGEMSISSVHGSKNWEIMGEDKNILYVFLERSLFPGDKVVLDIGFITKLAQVNHRTGVTAHTVNLGNFYPVLCGFKNGGFNECVYYSCGDPFYTDCADYKLRLTLPKEYTVASTGVLTDEDMLESKKVYTMYATKVRDFALVLSKNYRKERAKVGNTELVYYYYADKEPSKSLEVAREAFAYYEKAFGKYPYAQYTLAETGLCFGGMEYPTLTMLSDALSGRERVRAIAHEVAHQWWYGVVGSDQTKNAWQDEGLAEYSAICFFEEYEKYE
ncbi:MAG: M1 family metallopeptidase, partial [Clostridia bacterium]|nr:M1 family metallopeptidase [Clostridia bacterium]